MISLQRQYANTEGVRTVVFLLDDEDSDLVGLNWIVYQDRTGNYYAIRYYSIRFVEHREKLHRVILERKLGRSLEKGELSDHKDRNTLNCRRSNLRIASRLQNLANSLNRPIRDCPIGVYKYEYGYAAKINDHGVQNHLGTFQTMEEAHAAYKRRHVEIHGEFSPYYQEDQPMLLYRREWNRVRDRLSTIKQPTLSIQTLTKRVGELLDGPSVRDPLYLSITESQTEWIEKWCGYKTIHSRQDSRKARGHETDEV